MWVLALLLLVMALCSLGSVLRHTRLGLRWRRWFIGRAWEQQEKSGRRTYD